MKSKFIIIGGFATILIFLIFACNKLEPKEDITNESITALTDVSFNPEFDWELTRIITLNISSENAQVIKVTSTDKTICYYKGMLTNNAETYVVKISVPLKVDKLNVNGQKLDLSSDNISIDL